MSTGTAESNVTYNPTACPTYLCNTSTQYAVWKVRQIP